MVTDIICEAVEIEREFICESLPVKLIGMNSDMMSEYIDFCADRLLISLGCSKHYNTVNPFNWMEQISLQYDLSHLRPVFFPAQDTCSVENVLSFMPPQTDLLITICMFRGKTNFFERRVGEYQKSSVMAKLKDGDVHEFKTDCDF